MIHVIVLLHKISSLLLISVFLAPNPPVNVRFPSTGKAPNFINITWDAPRQPSKFSSFKLDYRLYGSTHPYESKITLENHVVIDYGLERGKLYEVIVRTESNAVFSSRVTKSVNTGEYDDNL